MTRRPRRLAVAALTALVSAAPTTAPTAPLPKAAASPPPTLTLDLGKGMKLALVRVPAGTFVMGSPEAEAERDPSEGPQHTVTIGKPFWIGKYEVTQAQWVGVAGPNQSQFQKLPDHDGLPCECVSWTDCQKFCDAATKLLGHPVRLPSEAEWEYAARGGTTAAFGVGGPGDALSSAAANFNGTAPYGNAPAGPQRDRTVAGGSFPANAFGLCDTVGNVNEWCQDVYHDTYDGAPADGSAWVAGGKPNLRVYRGGAYNNDASSCRSAVRFASDGAETRNGTLGFRVVVDDADAK